MIHYFHDFLQDDVWCVGWQNSGMQSKDARDMTLLGGMVLNWVFILNLVIILYNVDCAMVMSTSRLSRSHPRLHNCLFKVTDSAL